MTTALFTAILFLFSIVSSFAATFESIVDGNKAGNIVVVDGPIEKGDSDKLEALVSKQKVRRLLLRSPGGLVIEALQIARTVRKLKITTVVDFNNDCASACALIWLAGSRLELSELARVGMHASYEVHGQQKIESGWSNAIIGGYLRDLGYSDAAIILFTSTPPESIHWLTYADAKELGMHIRLIFSGPTPLGPNPDVTRRLDWPICIDKNFRGLVGETCKKISN